MAEKSFSIENTDKSSVTTETGLSIAFTCDFCYTSAVADLRMRVANVCICSPWAEVWHTEVDIF